MGAGQLARMMAEEADDVAVELTVLATSLQDCAASTAHRVVLGQPHDEVALRTLSSCCDVVTFDHELVDLDLLAKLEADGVVMRPSASTLRYSVDKAVQREEFAAAGFPVPNYRVLRHENQLEGILDWSQRYGAPPVVKAARGGYDGRGVLFPRDDDEAQRDARELLRSGNTVVIEERVELLSEVAQLVVRSTQGHFESYPLVTTVQSRGMCSEVRFPSGQFPELEAEARELSRKIAEFIDLQGVMAVEYFVTPCGLLVNELALRPHNSGHWTIEGSVTSQFANHLRAVSGQDLGPTTSLFRAAVMVNVVGAEQPGSLDAARQIEGVNVHDYGKTWHCGRKLGHVTAVGDDIDALHVRAWRSAQAYGTQTQEA